MTRYLTGGTIRVTMLRTTPKVIDHSAQQAHEWSREVARTLGHDDQREAYRVLRVVLHVIRDRIPVNESAQLASQLPTLIRGVYYEGWRPSAVPDPYHDVGAMLARVADEAGLAGETEASLAVTAVADLLWRHVSAGELEDVLAVFPEAIRPLLRGQPDGDMR
jgi:uncharacterized protein (DUF2267 family)